MAKVRGVVAVRDLTGKIAYYNGTKSHRGRVYVTNHTIFTGGGLCNWVTFRYIKLDGTLGRKGGDYDRNNNFERVTKAELKVLN